MRKEDVEDMQMIALGEYKFARDRHERDGSPEALAIAQAHAQLAILCEIAIWLKQ